MVDWQQSRRKQQHPGFLCFHLSNHQRRESGGGRELWHSAQPTPVKFTFCLPRVRLAKTFQVRNLETCQFDFSLWKNGIFVHKINFLKNQFFKKGMFSQKILLTELSQIPSMGICLCWGGSIQGLQNMDSDGLMWDCVWNLPHPTAFMNMPLYLPLKGVHGCEKSTIWMNKI